VLFTFPSRYLCTIGRQGVFRLGGWSPHVQTGFHVPRPTQGFSAVKRLRGSHPLWRTFPDPSASQPKTTGLLRFRSPLLAESLLMSFPPGTEMFQFPGFASCTYVFSTGSPSREGFPHSDIRGSTIARISPRLFAACHVLLRLLAPRHPPNALITLVPLNQHRPRAGPNRAVNPHDQPTSSAPATLIASANSTHFGQTITPHRTPSQGCHQGRRSSARSDAILKEHAQPQPTAMTGSSCEGRTPHPDSKHPTMEASGFEPLTPCLQSRCSTN
jgi:hypothetical protein